ncbi:MAG: phosphopantetheinyl transferase [Rhodovulum sulfidophilum]|uniref:Enterobactin synthase component D n=1 Tax=Rhodovulum sulfidophilum TaxID=35806 RepID=A0A2W5ND96_RHOSU|nr:MAG: phosphopantetheinyl transferase [Rhodovulum sulfidophilum]
MIAEETTAEAVARALRAACPPEVAVATLDARVSRDGLVGFEHAATRGMIERRRREFTGGRLAARAAMAALGVAPGAVPMGRDRAPVWPGGVLGSITHSAAVCAAAVARRGAVLAIGIDVEADRPLPPALVAVCCGPAERDWLERQPAAERGRLAMLIFSAKESAYKCQYPLSGALLGYHDLEILPDRARGGFTARFGIAAGPFAPGFRLGGRFGFAAGQVVTVATLPA